MSWLIYVFAALIDSIAAQVSFVNAVRLAQMGASDWIVTGVWSAFSLPYVCVCLMVGRFLNPRNAARILLASCAMFTLNCALFPFTRTTADIMVMTAFSGVSAGLFFPAFQIFMKTVVTRQSGSIAYSTGVYTFSWSTGFALGPFIAGFIMETGPAGWKLTYMVSALMALISGIGIWFLRHHGRPVQDATAAETVAVAAPAGAPDLAWLGWVSAVMGVGAIAVVRSLFPAMAEKEMFLAESRQGLVLFLVSIAQALTGLALCRSRAWMYRPGGVVLFGLLGVMGVAGFALSRSVEALCVAAVAAGIYSGSFFFYMVFHALVHSSRSVRYISINEMVVGATGTLSPLAAGLLSGALHSYAQTFAVFALLLGATVLFQAAVHVRRPLANLS